MIIYSLTFNHFTCNRSASAVLRARKFKIEHQSLATDKTRIICLRHHFGNGLSTCMKMDVVFSGYRFSILVHIRFVTTFILAVKCFFFNFVLSQEKTWRIVLSSLWMGHAMYFSLGNSNSLASIDVSAGYVGLEYYVPGVVGPFMFVATYCGPILWLIAAVLSIMQDAGNINR